MKKCLKRNIFCGYVLLTQKSNILQYNQHLKPGKILQVIYAGIESLIKRIDNCKYNPEKTSTARIKHIRDSYLMPTTWTNDHIENKGRLYQRKKLYKKSCESLREKAKSMIDFDNKKNVAVNKKRTTTTSRNNRTLHLQKKIIKKLVKDKNSPKVKNYCHYTGKYRVATHNILRFNL